MAATATTPTQFWPGVRVTELVGKRSGRGGVLMSLQPDQVSQYTYTDKCYARPGINIVIALPLHIWMLLHIQTTTIVGKKWLVKWDHGGQSVCAHTNIQLEIPGSINPSENEYLQIYFLFNVRWRSKQNATFSFPPLIRRAWCAQTRRSYTSPAPHKATATHGTNAAV